MTLAAGPKTVFVGFSPDGKRVATVAIVKEGTEHPPRPILGGPLRLWDVQTGGEQLSLANGWPVIAKVVFSPDGNFVATVSGDGDCTIWDTAAGQERLAVKMPPQRTPGLTTVRGLRFAPGGQMIAVMSHDDRDLQLWELSSARLRATIPGVGPTSGGLRCGFAFSPDGTSLAVREELKESVRPWLSLLACFSIVGNQPVIGSHGAFARRLDLADSYQVMKIRDVTTGAVRRTLPGALRHGRSIAFSPNGQELATDTGGSAGDPGSAEIKRWDTRTGEERPAIQIEAYPFRNTQPDDLQYTGDGRALRADYSSGSFLWDLLATPPQQLTLGEISTSSDGTLLAVGDITQVRLLELPAMKERHALGGGTGISVARPLGFTPDGRTLAVTQLDNDLKWLKVSFFDVVTGRQIGATADVPYPLIVTLAADGRTSIYAVGDAILARGVPPQRPPRQVVGSLPFHLNVDLGADGRTVVDSDRDSIRLWDVPPRRPWWQIFGGSCIPAALVALVGWRRQRV